MGKDKSEKKEKKEKKEKRSEADGVVKKSKKDKKEKRKSTSDVKDALMEDLAKQETAKPVPAEEAMDKDGDVDMDGNVNGEVAITGALVPFANPLADEKQAKKVMKCVKKCRFYLSFCRIRIQSYYILFQLLLAPHFLPCPSSITRELITAPIRSRETQDS